MVQIPDRNGSITDVWTSGTEVRAVTRESGRSCALYYSPAGARALAAALLHAADDAESGVSEAARLRVELARDES